MASQTEKTQQVAMIQISTTSTPSGLTILHGVDRNGTVYMYSSTRKGWIPLSMELKESSIGG